jgi:hypothetical protein
MKRTLVILSLLLAVGAIASAADVKPLAITTNATTVDGVVKPNEYSFAQDLGTFRVYANRTADVLSVAVVGKTTGWVSIGLGSMRMAGSTMFYGYVDSSGAVQYKTRIGTGHKHADAEKAVQDTVVARAVAESAAGYTTVEVQLKPGAYLKAGQTGLDVIFAKGAADDFASMHNGRGALAIPLAQ